MEGQPIAIIAVAIISILGNIIQYLMNKKYNDIKDLDQQVALLSNLQKEQSISYENAKKMQENKIKDLEQKIKDQDNKMKEQSLKIEDLQRLVSRLIGNGCHLNDCPNRSPYTIEEINEMTKGNNKNEKNNNRNKK